MDDNGKNTVNSESFIDSMRSDVKTLQHNLELLESGENYVCVSGCDSRDIAGCVSSVRYGELVSHVKRLINEEIYRLKFHIRLIDGEKEQD